MEAVQPRTDFGQEKSCVPIFELDAAEIEAVSGAGLVSITPIGRTGYGTVNGGYYEVQKWTFSDGHVEYHTVVISIA